jgi:uncharacterized protein YndB with AHSA1/START domain
MATTTKNPPSTRRRASITTPRERTIVCEREFDAPRDRVWRAYTEPKLLAQWWARGNRMDVEAFELKPNGRWRFVEHSEEGKEGFEGYFREVTPQSRIVQTFEWDGMKGYPILNTAEFTDLPGGRTKIVTTSLFYSDDERDGFMKSGFEGGINQSYDSLDRLLSKT